MPSLDFPLPYHSELQSTLTQLEWRGGATTHFVAKQTFFFMVTILNINVFPCRKMSSILYYSRECVQWAATSGWAVNK